MQGRGEGVLRLAPPPLPLTPPLVRHTELSRVATAGLGGELP